MKLDKYGPIISSQEAGEEIYTEIKESLKKHEKISIDLKRIQTMATFCAKQIFGKLYLELKPETFFEKIQLVNVNNDLKVIIRLGILSALGDRN